MDLGLANGIYSNKLEGNATGLYDSIRTGLHNGIYNDLTLYNKIIKNGLICNYDAGFYQSYPKNGTTIYDLTTNNLNATLTNNPTYSEINRGVLNFNGSNTYLKPPNNNLFAFNSFTLSSWIKTNTQNTNRYIIDCSQNGTTAAGYSFRITTSNVIRYWAYSAAVSDFVDGITTINSNTWYLITCTFNANTLNQKIFINGKFESNKIITFLGYLPSTPSFLQIGGSQILGGYFSGQMTQHLFYNRELSDAEVLINYLATKSRFNL